MLKSLTSSISLGEEVLRGGIEKILLIILRASSFYGMAARGFSKNLFVIGPRIQGMQEVRKNTIFGVRGKLRFFRKNHHF